jgi:hypothetical protein
MKTWKHPIHWPPGKGPADVKSTGESPDAQKCDELSAGINLLTSLSLMPKHMEVQSRCLDSWVTVGCKVIAQNTAEEINQLKPIYHQVHEWIECDDTSTAYEYPTQKLISLAESAAALDAAIINSDIEIICRQKQLKSLIERSESEFVLGIRWNYSVSPSHAREFEWGFDLIAMSPEQVGLLPKDMPFAIGQPMWDYALPEILMMFGFKPKISHSRVLFHHDHPQHWNDRSHRLGKNWLANFTGQPFDDVWFRRSIDSEYLYYKSDGVYRRNHWMPLHWYAPLNRKVWGPQEARQWFFEGWQPGIPESCGCSEKWASLPTPSKDIFDTPQSFFRWGWDRHNHVSRYHASKPVMSFHDAVSWFWPSHAMPG